MNQGNLLEVLRDDGDARFFRHTVGLIVEGFEEVEDEAAGETLRIPQWELV